MVIQLSSRLKTRSIVLSLAFKTATTSSTITNMAILALSLPISSNIRSNVWQMAAREKRDKSKQDFNPLRRSCREWDLRRSDTLPGTKTASLSSHCSRKKLMMRSAGIAKRTSFRFEIRMSTCLPSLSPHPRKCALRSEQRLINVSMDPRRAPHRCRLRSITRP